MSETALARIERSDASLQEWRQERVDLVRKTICPRGISEAEFELFIEICKRSGLDPLTKEIFCVPRRTNIGSKEDPKWIVKHEAQPAEAGLLARADRFPDFGGIKAAAFYEGEDIVVTENEVHHKFNPTKRTGKLLGAWAQAFRNGRVLPVEIVTIGAYQQNTQQWHQRPEVMIVKCARAAALRRAYPNTFGGLYVEDEMPAEEFKPLPDEPAKQLAPVPQAALAAQTAALKATPSPATTPTAPKVCDHVWDMKGVCAGCGAKETKSTQSPALRARAMKVFKRAKAGGQSVDAFQAWTAVVLGRPTPSQEWTEDDVSHLENALTELLSEPGTEG